MEDKEKIVGKVKKIVFEGDGNYTIAIVDAEDYFFDLTVKGVMRLAVGETFEFFGVTKSDERFGEFFNVVKYQRPDIIGGDNIINYLSSSIFSGIGKRTAKKIYDAFGEETLTVIKDNPALLLQMGISPTIVTELNEKHSQGDLLSDLYEVLAPFEYSDFLIQEIYKFLDEKISGNKIKYLVDNPYKLINKIYAFNFVKADEIYLYNHENYDLEDRLICLLVDIINNKCYQSGDTVVNINTVKLDYNKRRGNTSIPFDIALNYAISKKQVLEMDGCVAAAEFFNTEKSIAKNVSLRLNSTIRKINQKTIISNLAKLESQFNINYSDLQKKAILNALDSNFSVITGGPGTGKTTIIKAIVTLFSDLKYKDVSIKDISEKVMLCAPTGRAAQRMKEATGFESKTIHALLGWDPYNNSFSKDLESPLMQELIVIDEFSMVDIFLANALFKAIRPNCIIVIVGDKAQLESVNPGKVLADLLEIEDIPSVQLDAIYRQGEGSTIAQLAKQINNNDKIELINTDDMSVFDRNGDLTPLVKTIYDRSIKVGYKPIDVQVLYPKYKGINGIDRLNEVLKPEVVSESIEINGVVYQLGDKIMQLKNDSERDVYNGDIGFISQIVNKDAKGNALCIEINIRNKKIPVTRSQVDEITHAYAISVHKSQGSEFNVIILPITNESKNMLTKKLIYTAITRTRDKLVILGDVDVFYSGLQEFDYSRKTRLRDYLLDDLASTEATPFDFL